MKDASIHGYGLNIESLPKTSNEAHHSGSRFYFTGKPCKYGHIAPRYTKAGGCVQCQRVVNVKREGLDESRAGVKGRKHFTRLLAAQSNQLTYTPIEPCKNGHMTRWVSTNNCVKCDEDARKRHKISAKFARIKKEYQLTREQYLAMVENQGGRCAICSTRPDSHFSLHIDHCHTTNVVRGLLCQQCNQAIGLLKDDPELFSNAMTYLSK
jgi:hypothetical protein